MDIEEEISERIIRQAFEGGGEVIFTDTELKECTDRKLLQKVNLQLSLYGAINDITILGRWSIFKINEKGIRFIRQGGFKGEREREQRKDELERLTLDKCTSLGGTTSGQAKGGKANGEKRRKEAMNDEKNNMIAAMLEGCNTPQDIDKVVERLNARGILTKTGLPFTRNRLTALRTKINRRTEYIQSML